MVKYVGSIAVFAIGVICILFGTFFGLGPVLYSGWLALALGALLLYAEWKDITIALRVKGPGLLQSLHGGIQSISSDLGLSSNSSASSPASSSRSSTSSSHSSASTSSHSSSNSRSGSSTALDISQGGINAFKFLLCGLIFLMGLWMAIGLNPLALLMFALAYFILVDVKKTEQRLEAALMRKK